jgi:hypothetical protein
MQLTPTTTVREVLTAHPTAAEVLLRHGMCADCQDNPPLVPLHHFATKHCGGDLDGLIEELTQAIGPQGAS